MISNDELQRKLQAESYKIICESISEEERTAMNLMPNQIIPTIIFLRNIQVALFRRFYEDKTYSRGNVEFEYCFEKWNSHEKKYITEPAVKKINLSFLKYLCKDIGIEFYIFEDRYHFELSKNSLYNDASKKYHI